MKDLDTLGQVMADQVRTGKGWTGQNRLVLVKTGKERVKMGQDGKGRVRTGQ